MKDSINKLIEEWKSSNVDLSSLPTHVEARTFETLPGLYQPRMRSNDYGVKDKGHVAKLSQHLRDPESELDPILVLHIDGRNIVIDGHHRLQAYLKSENRLIPVRYFPGSPVEALIEAGRDNVKERLQMTHQEKSQRAWELICSGIRLTGKQIHQASGRSKRLIAAMRKKFKYYNDAGETPPDTWVAALTGENNTRFTEEDVLAQVLEWSERLAQSIPPLTGPGRPDMFAQAIIQFSPERAPEITEQLIRHLGLEEYLMEKLKAELSEMADIEF